VKRLALALLCLGLSSAAMARDYGQAGAVFPIVEPDLLAQIRARLETLARSGETERLNAELKRRTIARVNRPTPVAGIGNARAVRTWVIDPTITLEDDIADNKGRVILKAGTRVNPLDTVPLRQPLIFLDGDDPDQLAWALAYRGDNKPGSAKPKLILVRGAPLELMKLRQRRFYFDQGGNLVKHFGIRAVPAVVEQQGRLLKVREAVVAARQGSTS
jgi:conjugal transfer pilus assembly protein TraW